jgi:hypothetical protein
MMTWHVQFTTHGGYSEVMRFLTPERAIEEACRLLDDGYDVIGIGTGPLTDSIARLEIERIYVMWAELRPRNHLQPEHRAQQPAR